MTDYIVRDTQLTSVANAIRTKGGTSDPLAFPDGFVSAVQAFPDAVTLDSLSVTENGVYTPSIGHAFGEVTVDVSGGGGGTEVEDAIIEQTISGSYTNSRVTMVGFGKFYHCSQLTAVSFARCLMVGSSAFIGCSNLTTISFPICTTIQSYVFQNCSKLTSAVFPACTTILRAAFDKCTNLSVISFPACKTLESGVFSSTAITSAYFPECTVIGSNAFYTCKSLITISFPKCSQISAGAFTYCQTLRSVYFLGTSVPTLSGNNAFANTPLSTLTPYGSIFVRASLLTAFQSTVNWSYYSARMVGLTDEEIAALDAQEGA